MGGNGIERVKGTVKIEEREWKRVDENGREKSAMREMKRMKMGREI